MFVVGASGFGAGNDLSDATTQSSLGFVAADLTGTYFVPGDYTITAVDGSGVATISVTGSAGNAPPGTYVLAVDGTWTKQ